MQTNHWSWRAAVLAAAGLQAVAPFFSLVTGVGVPIAERGTSVAGPEEPPGYAFTIWAVIFTLSLIYGVRQLRIDTLEEPLYAAIRPISFVLFLLNVAWMIAAQSVGNGPILVALIVAMLAAALAMFMRSVDIQTGSGVQTWIAAPLAGLYAGWLTLAVFLNASSALRDDYGVFGLSPTTYATWVLLAAGGLGLMIVRRARGSIWYAATLTWGLTAVVVSALQANDVTIASLSVGLNTLIVIATYFTRERARQAAS